jgi:hypothetical protein
MVFGWPRVHRTRIMVPLTNSNLRGKVLKTLRSIARGVAPVTEKGALI